jgi:tetratricopeptide (TPR) repeat protein
MGKRISFITGLLFIVVFFNGSAFARENALEDAQALILQGDYSRAGQECEQILASRPQPQIRCKALYFLGVCLLKEGRFAGAREKFNQVLRRFPRSELAAIARKHIEMCEEAKTRISDCFSVQMGCFSEKTNADKLRDELIDNGYQAYVLNLPVDAFYRVRIGKFGSKPDAEYLEQKLKAKGFSTRICP